MTIPEGEPSSSAAQAIGLIVAVKELQRLKALDLNKLLRDSENLTIQYCTKNGLLLKIDMEKLAGSLPLHLISMLISFKRDEALFRYLLSAVRLLYSLCDLASRNSKLEQIFLNDVKLFDQLLDFVFYMLIVLGGCKQEDHAFCHRHLVHSTLVPCTFYLLTGFISTKWQDVVHVLLAHPKIDIFMDAAFGSVRMVVRCLEITLLAYYNDFSMESNLTAEQVVYYLCQQCEASLQFLQSLCQQKLFKERLLMNKEICGEGSVLFLALSILKLQIQPSLPTRIKAALSRLKSKILSILLGLCEVESISYLDEVASSPQSLALAKSVASEVLDLLKIAFGRDSAHHNVDGCHPMGFVQLNAMRLADILSDDSNFRSYVMLCFTKVLTAIISLSHGDFLSCWCSSNLPETEEDCNVEYDTFAAVGWVLDYTSLDITNATNLEFIQIPNKMPRASYAHHKTSLLIKLFANLHCFVPNICEDMEENHFVLKVLECLQMDLSDILPGFSFASDAPKAAIASKNLRSLLSHAESLIPNYLNTEDLQLLRVFSSKLQSLFSSTGFEGNHIQDSKFELSVSQDKFTKLNINEHYQKKMKSGSRAAYQKVQEAKRNARARAAVQEVGTSTTPPRRQSLGLGTSSQPVLVNPIPTPPLPPSAYVPSVLSSSEPEKKKHKISEAGASNVGDTGFDGVKFSRKHILPYSQIAMDDAAIRNHLQILIREGIRTAGVCTSLLDILEKTPLSAIQSSVEHLKGRIALYQEEERKLQEENAQLKEELAQIREREKKLMGQCAMTKGLKEKVEQNYVRLFVDKIELKEELDKLREGYQELEEFVTEGIEVLFEVLKEQVRVLAPDLDLSPLHPDKVVVDGAIVSHPRPATDSELKTAGQRIIESPPREVDMPFSFSAPKVIRAPDAEEIPPTHSTSAAESTSSPADDSNPFISPQ